MTVLFKKRVIGFAAALFAVHALAGGDSSDGHTHAVQAPLVLAPVGAAAPRFNSQTDQFELVGVLQGTVLTLYLDQFDTNTPVPNAQIALESGAWKANATETSPAVYTVAADALAQAGKYPLTITVQAGDAVDLMDATLEVGPQSGANAGAVHTHSWGEWSVWWGAAALGLGALALVVVRRNRRQRHHSHQHIAR